MGELSYSPDNLALTKVVWGNILVKKSNFQNYHTIHY